MSNPKETRLPEFLAINHRGKTPVLIDGDIKINESIAILLYIEDYLGPNIPLLPPLANRSDRARALARIQETENLHTIYDALEDAHFDAANGETGPLTNNARDDLVQAVYQELDFWERYAGEADYIAGPQFTLADAAFFPFLGYMLHRGFQWNSTRWPNLQQYYDRVWAKDCAKKAQPEGWEGRGRANVFMGTRGGAKPLYSGHEQPDIVAANLLTQTLSVVFELQRKAIMQPSDLANLLKKLKQSVVATEDTLRETKVGLTVGRLRTHESTEVSDLAKEIVKKWKGDVDDEKKKKLSSLKAPVKSDGPRTAKSDGVSFPTLGDKTRDTCRLLIYDSLAIDSGAPIDLIMNRSTAVEQTVFDNCGSSNADYRQKMRSLYLNLKGKENPSLREGVVSGSIPAAKLAVMTSAEMASEERKQKDREIEQANLFKSLGAGEQQAETDAFQCGKCKATRSADEPMT
ncbi:5138_t:CDS:2, partial [Acaulospora colombiana]